MMKSRVYLETTVPSYLTSRPSRDLMLLANQQATREWWAKRSEFDLYISLLVIQECRAGDPRAAVERLTALKGIPVLRQKPETVLLGRSLRRFRCRRKLRRMPSTSPSPRSTRSTTC